MVSPNEFLKSEMDVLSRGFIPPEEVEAVERQPIAMIRSRISWGSVIAGSLLTFGLLLLSSSFAVACGVPAMIGTGDYGFGTGFWAVLTCIIAYGSGAWLSACLTSAVDSRYRVIHGIMTWALTVALVLVFSQGMLGGATIAGDVRLMTLVAPHNNGAWGAFLGMFFGLAAALAGGLLVDASLTRSAREPKTRIAPGTGA